MSEIDTGYVRIANDILEAIIAFDFTKREQKVVLAVARKTYGYNKKADAISLWQISQLTNIQRGHVSTTINTLIEKNILIDYQDDVVIRGQAIRKIGINKHVNQWLTVPKTYTVDRTQNVYGQAKKGVPKTDTVTVYKTGHDRIQNGNATVYKTGTTKDSTKDKQKTVKTIGAEWQPPGWLNKQAWAEFEQHRKEIKKPLTDLSRTKAANLLKPLALDQQQACVDSTIANRWQGLFPDRFMPTNLQQRGKPNAPASAVDRVRAANQINQPESSDEPGIIEGECTRVTTH